MAPEWRTEQVFHKLQGCDRFACYSESISDMTYLRKVVPVCTEVCFARNRQREVVPRIKFITRLL